MRPRKTIQLPTPQALTTHLTEAVIDSRIPAPGYRCLDCRRPNTVVHGDRQDRRRLGKVGLTILCGRCGGARIALHA